MIMLMIKNDLMIEYFQVTHSCQVYWILPVPGLQIPQETTGKSVISTISHNLPFFIKISWICQFSKKVVKFLAFKFTHCEAKSYLLSGLQDREITSINLVHLIMQSYRPHPSLTTSFVCYRTEQSRCPYGYGFATSRFLNSIFSFGFRFFF